MKKQRKGRKPRYTYQDTPKGRFRTDRKTGKKQWRPLGVNFPQIKRG